MSLVENSCFICEDNCDEDISGDVKPMPWEGERAGSSILECQLSVMLLVQKILVIPSSILESILSTKGDPSSWGLRMCGPCRRVFIEAEFIHSRITELNQEFNQLSQKLRRQLKNEWKSKLPEVNSTNSVRAGILNLNDKRRSGGRRSRRKRNRNTASLPTPAPRQVVDAGDNKTVQGDSYHKNFLDFAKIGKVERSEVHGVLKSSSIFSDELPVLSPHPHPGADEAIVDIDISKNKEVIMDDDNMDVEDDPLSPLVDDDNDSDFNLDHANTNTSSTRTSRRRTRTRRRSSTVNTQNLIIGKARKKVNISSIPQPIKDKHKNEYLCPMCPRKAFCKSSMYGHILRNHYGDPKPFHCHLCERTFKRETLLRLHLERMHRGAKTPLDEPDDEEATNELVETEGPIEADSEDVLGTVAPSGTALDVNSMEQQNPPVKEKARTLDCDLCPKMKYRVLYKNLETLEAHKKRVHFGIKRPYECTLCKKSFKLPDVLRQHLLVHKRKVREKKGKNRPFCLECNREFRDQITLSMHMEKEGHSADYPFPCDQEGCEVGFLLETQLEAHKADHKAKEERERAKQEEKAKAKKVPEKKRYFCGECDRVFKNAACLKAHMEFTKFHSAENKYICELCTKGFMQKSSLANHQSQEHYKELNKDPFKCTVCSKILSSRRALDHHMRLLHTGDTLFKCKECNLGFMFEVIYKRHISVVHAKERKLLCDFCPKRFSLKNHLDTHMRVHTGEKPYKCKVCWKEYADRPTFNRHMETHGDQVHTCDFCSKTFKVWHTFRLHMRSAHKQTVNKIPVIRVPAIKEDDPSTSNSVANASSISVGRFEAKMNDSTENRTESDLQLQNSLLALIPDGSTSGVIESPSTSTVITIDPANF